MADILASRAKRNRSATGGGTGTLTVVLVNAMSDAALAITERRFTRMMQSALPGRTVDLRCVTLPQIPRGEMAAARIARFYLPPADLLASPPDAVIFSGAEPVTDELRDEVFWLGLTALFDWVDAEGIPTLFSCLAAHAAVLHFSGVRRRRRVRKMFGMFRQFAAQPHPFLRGAPPALQVAHSRWNELSAADLAAAGYLVLTSGPETEVDMFVPCSGAPQLFLQGHPEYEAAALEGEYRRDTRRFQSGETPHPPHRPVYASDLDLPSEISGFADGAAPYPDEPQQSFTDILVSNWIVSSQEKTG